MNTLLLRWWRSVNTYYPGDDLFTPFTRRRGIPIGNLTSQFFANIYLDGLDHFVKENLHCRNYLRYVDDIAVFGDDKKHLWNVRQAMAEYLASLRLSLHPEKTYLVPVQEGVDHLGYRVFPDHRRIRKDNGFHFVRRLQRLQKGFGCGAVSFQEMNASIQSWIGHAKHADTYGLRRAIFCDLPLLLSLERKSIWKKRREGMTVKLLQSLYYPLK